MEHAMASKPITYQAEPETPAPDGSAASSISWLAAFASAFATYGIWDDSRVLERADAAARRWSLSAWFGTVAARCARAIANEVRIRRDTRQLMLMSDRMLKDIGLTRAQVDRALRYGRE
jgi:uncharacterized protein YjiS (DUF1127 family)